MYHPSSPYTYLTKKQNEIMERVKMQKNMISKRKSLCGNTRPNCKQRHVINYSRNKIVIAFSKMQIIMTEIMKKTNCLRYHVLQSAHCFKPIINMVSRMRVSFSSTSSWASKLISITRIHNINGKSVL